MGQTLRISNHFSRHLRQRDMWRACRAACKEHVKKQHQQLMHERWNRWNAGCLCTRLLTGYTGGKAHVSQKLKKKKKRNVINVTPELQGETSCTRAASYSVKMAELAKLVSTQVITFMSKLSGSARQTYFLWKAWEHGHTPSSSRLRNSSKHTAHVCCRGKRKMMENDRKLLRARVCLSMQLFMSPQQ